MMRSYGTLVLTTASPPQSFSEPLALDQVQQALNLPSAQDDDLLLSMITAARILAEAAQNRALVLKQYDLTLDHFWNCSPGHEQHREHWQGVYNSPFATEIELKAPLVSVELVRYRDSDGNYTSLVEGVDYVADLSRALIIPPIGQTWPSFTPWPSSAVLIRFTSGMKGDDVFWSDAGQVVLGGMKYLISQWYTNRIPFEPSRGKIEEYPYSVTSLLSFGAIPRAR